MRVLNIMSRFNVGGTAPWLFFLSTGLTQRGINNLSLIGNCPKTELEDTRINNLEAIRIEGLGPGSSFFTTLKSIHQIRREIKKFRPDIVNTHTSRAGVVGRLATIGIRPGVTVVHTFHGHILRGYFGRLKVSLIRLVERALSHYTDFFFVVGESVLKDLEKAKILKSERSLSVWPAVKDFAASSKPIKRNVLGIPETAVVFGWLGRKVPIKRLDKVIDLATARPKIFFVVAGAGKSLRESYPEKFSSTMINNIIDLGFTEPAEFWKMVDAGILTSDNEGIPSAPIEASLAEKPSVLINVGSVNEVVISGSTGYLCDSNIESLLEAIDYLVNNESSRLEMGQNARTFALAKFNPDSSVERQIEGYNKALKLSGGL